MDFGLFDTWNALYAGTKSLGTLIIPAEKCLNQRLTTRIRLVD
ncbi:MAG: hypothetical protein CM1200mP22_00610 [Dehalococcoidia bacterium]|nr:MAG: hypothetical protein CM1200mP22_00610 [Dehalococcoidia bacterium]